MNETKIEKLTFTYSLLFRIIFKFGNLIIATLLILYSFPLLALIDEKKILIIPLAANLLVIYFLNRYYLALYKILPYKIEADDEKLICSHYFLSKKEVIIHYDNIDILSGGAFENKISGLMKICDDKNNICICFYRRLTHSSRLVTIILSKVKNELYDEILEKLIIQKKKN